MRKVKVFFQRLFKASFKRMFRNIDLVHQEFGKSRVLIFFDMLYSMVVYGTGYLDYMTFGFAGIKKDKRRTFITMNDNLFLDRKLNDKAYELEIENKTKFNKNFHDFLHRDFLDLEQAGEEGFVRFCQDKTVLFAKQLESYGGLGVRKIKLSEHEDLSALYRELMEHKMTLVEEAIVQHPELNRLCPSSINTMRIVTLVNDQQEPCIAYALLRIGNGTNDVDNVSSGGMYSLIGEDGVLHFPAFCDRVVTYYEKHPVTGTEILNFKIPRYEEAIAMVKEAALRIPQMRYVGWDVAMTPDGPCLVEGNVLPGYDMPQNHLFHPDGIGYKPLFEKILNTTFDYK